MGPSNGQWDDGSILLELKVPGSDDEAREWWRKSLFFGVPGQGKGVEEDMRQDVFRPDSCVLER